MPNMRRLLFAQAVAIHVGFFLSSYIALGDPQDLVLQKIGNLQTCVSSGKLPRNALVRIKINKAANDELAVWMYNPAEKKLLNAASQTVYGSRLNPARVWQAGTRSPASNEIEELHRDTRRLTEGQVLEYSVRDYRPSDYKPEEPEGIAINSSEDFLVGSKTSNAVSVTKNGDIYRLVLDDGWELDIKIVMPSL
jgi:hypothetical protein